MPNTVPNQRIAHIHRDMPLKGDNDFLVVKNSNLYNAHRILRENRRGGTPLFLWLYLVGNKDGYDLALSPQAIERKTGLPQSTCRDSFRDLMETGFLVPVRDGSNVYDFYENPAFAPRVKEEVAADSAPKFVF